VPGPDRHRLGSARPPICTASDLHRPRLARPTVGTASDLHGPRSAPLLIPTGRDFHGPGVACVPACAGTASPVVVLPARPGDPPLGGSPPAEGRARSQGPARAGEGCRGGRAEARRARSARPGLSAVDAVTRPRSRSHPVRAEIGARPVDPVLSQPRRRAAGPERVAPPSRHCLVHLRPAVEAHDARPRGQPRRP